MSIFIRQNLVPHVAVRIISPQEELLSRYNMAIRHMHGSGILGIIISGQEFHFAAPGKDRARIALIISPTGQIDLFAATQYRFAHRPFRKIDLMMIGTKLYIGWENHLIMFITMYGNIRPIQH